MFEQFYFPLFMTGSKYHGNLYRVSFIVVGRFGLLWSEIESDPVCADLDRIWINFLVQIGLNFGFIYFHGFGFGFGRGLDWILNLNNFADLDSD
jgi:hypothetical protein